MKIHNTKSFYLISLIITILTSSLTLSAGPCNNALMKDEMCYKMRHLRSQVMALGEQRELMQLNYPYLYVLGNEVEFLAKSIDVSKVVELGHPEGLEGLVLASKNLKDLAEQKNPLALSAANSLQKRCATCHIQSSPEGGHTWDKVFRYDWEVISKNCSQEGRNPYLCKSMNGMLSAYATVMTGPNAGREDLHALSLGVEEIARIAKDLKEKGLFHGSEDIISEVELKANATAQLARNGDPEAFTAAQSINNACMQCHASRSISSITSPFKLNPFLTIKK